MTDNNPLGRAMVAASTLGPAIKAAADLERAMAQVTDTLTCTRCACGDLFWIGPTTAVYLHGTLHAPEDCEADS